MENVINTLHLSGKVVGTPVVGHEAFGEKFYYLTLGVPRLSGAQDLLPVTLSERLLDGRGGKRRELRRRAFRHGPGRRAGLPDPADGP